MDTIIPVKRKTENWREVLWWEKRLCEDRDYAKHLRRILLTEPSSWFYAFTLRQQERPYAAEIEAALETACDAHRGIKYYWQNRLDRLEKAKRKQTPLSKLIANLEDHHWFERFLSRHVLLYRGGEAAETLVELIHTDSPIEHSLITWLILSIGEETKERLAKDVDKLLCPRCVVRCHPLEIDLPQGSVKYYGCRLCHQSVDFQMWPEDGVIAVLDRKTQKRKTQNNSQIRVNWLALRRLFDFDRVEITQATDEEVERFAVQVGNDTNERQGSRYKEMICTVSSDCGLSENTMRILRYTFGSVEVKELA